MCVCVCVCVCVFARVWRAINVFRLALKRCIYDSDDEMTWIPILLICIGRFCRQIKLCLNCDES